MAHDSSLEPVLRAVEPAVRLIPERYLREVLHYLIDRDQPQPGDPNLPLWVSRGTLVEAELLPAHILAGTESQLLLVTDPDDRMIEHLPVAERLREYWRVLFQAAVMREIDRKVQAGVLTAAACRDRLARFGPAAAREIRYVLETEHLVSAEANDIGRYRAFAAVYLDLASFGGHAGEDFFPSLPHGPAVARALGEDVDAAGLLAATRPAGAADPHREPDPDDRWLANDTRTIGRPAARTEPVGLLGAALEAERRGNNVRAAILRTQAAATLTGHEREQAVGGARAAMGKLVDSLAAMFDWDGDTRQEWRQALGPLLEMAAAGGIWPRAARCLYELQKIPADLSREVFAVDLAETIRTFGRRPVKRPLPHARPVLVLMGLKRGYNQMLRAGLGHAAQLRLDRLFHHLIHRLEHRIRHDFTPIITTSLTEAGLVPTTTVEEVARDKIVAELLDRVCERGYLRIGNLRDSIARNRLKMPDLAGPGEFFRGDALLRADINLAYSLDGVYRKGEFYLRWIQQFSAILFGTLLGRLFTLYVALPFGGSFLALMFTEHLWHKVEGWFQKPAPAARVAPQPQPGTAAAPGAGGQPAPDLVAADDVGVDENGGIWWEPRDPDTVAPRDVDVTGTGDVVVQWEQLPIVQAATEVIPSRTPATAHHEGEPTFLTETTTILAFGVFLLLLFHLSPFRRAVFFVLGYVWWVVRGLFWDLPRWVWRSQAIREFRQSRGVRLLHRHFWSPLLITAIVFTAMILLGVRSWFLFKWGWAIWAGLTIVYNTPWGWVLQDRVAEAVSDWWRVVRVNLIPGLVVTIVDLFRRLGNWIERRLYAVDEWLRYRGGDSQRSLVTKAVLGLLWFPFAYVFRFAFYLLIEPQINPIKHFPVVTVSHKMLLPLVLTKDPNTILSPFGELLAENLGWSIPSSNFWAFWIIAGIPGIFGFIAWELLSNWQLYRANRGDRLRPVVLGSHGESMRGLLRPGFHSGTIPKLFKKLRHADRAKAGRLHHELEHAAEGIHRFVERELVHVLERAPDWGGVRVHVGAVRFGCQRLTVELVAQSLGRDGFALSFENVGGQIEASVDQVGWADKLTEPQRAAFVAALRGLLDMAAVERIDGRDRVEAATPLGPGFADLVRRVGWVEWVERWRVPTAA